MLLAPVFVSSSHGYDTIDYFNVDPRLGTNADLVWLIETCHAHNVRIVLDGVFNHVGRLFPQFVDVRMHRQSSQYASWFNINWSDTNNEDGFSYANFEGHQRLVKLNHDNHHVQNFVTQVMTHWLNMGIDGWRLDASYAVPLSFWRQVLYDVRNKFPDAWFLGEVIHGDYKSFVKEGHLESITQYELWKAIWSALNDRNFFELSHALSRNTTFNQSFLPNIFLGNHDVTRIASALTDDRHLAHAVAILLTVPGTPSIYYGDEQGYKAVKEKRAGGDDAIRPGFPATPEQFTEPDWNVFQLYRELIELRHNNLWISSALLKTISLSNQFFVYETAYGAQCLQVALNVGDGLGQLAISHNCQVLRAGTAYKSGNDWQIPAHSLAIFGPDGPE